VRCGMHLMSVHAPIYLLTLHIGSLYLEMRYTATMDLPLDASDLQARTHNHTPSTLDLHTHKLSLPMTRLPLYLLNVAH